MQICKVGQRSSNFIRWEEKNKQNKKSQLKLGSFFFFAKWGSVAQRRRKRDPLDECHFLLRQRVDSSRLIAGPRWQSGN